MEYAIIENNIIKDIISTNDKVSKEYVEIPADFEITIGADVRHFDKNYKKKSGQTLVKEGLLEDVTGIWYTEKQQKIDISDFFYDMADKNWTRNKPKHPTDKLIEDCWIEQTEDKLAYDQKTERNWRDTELFNIIDHYQKPLVWEELSEEKKQAIRNYRKYLLNYPQQDDFPYGTRPIADETILN